MDAQGIYIDYSLLPNDADYTNDEGMNSVPLSSRLPNIKWEKQPNGEWQLSTTSIQHIQDVYQQTFSNHVNALLDRLPAHFSKTSWDSDMAVFAVHHHIDPVLVGWKIVDRVIYAQILRYVETHDVALQPEQLLPVRPIVWLSISVCFLAGIPDLQLPIRSSQGLFFISRLILSISAVLLFSRIIDF